MKGRANSSRYVMLLNKNITPSSHLESYGNVKSMANWKEFITVHTMESPQPSSYSGFHFISKPIAASSGIRLQLLRSSSLPRTKYAEERPTCRDRQSQHSSPMKYMEKFQPVKRNGNGKPRQRLVYRQRPSQTPVSSRASERKPHSNGVIPLRFMELFPWSPMGIDAT